ncbi:MAG: glutathione S-transferase family protein [Solirubrobacterales bacterium]|nr:glutathione S-transferase family protein [Solirubrobacterales bacterium]
MTDLSRTTITPSDHTDPAPPVLWQLQISHYVEKVRWALDYKRVPHIRRSLLPGVHVVKTKRLSGDTSTAPVLTLDGRSIGDSTRIIAAIEERWPQPPLYPEDAAQRRRALELEDFFDEELGPHIRRAFYHELLPHPELVVPLFTQGRRRAPRALLRGGFPVLRMAMKRRFNISAESAAHSRAKMVAAMDRLEREISSSGYLVGDSFTVADLTAAALFYGVARPPEFPYPMVAVDDMPDSWREFLDSLAQRPGGQWLTQMYRRHRGQSAELTTADLKKASRPDARDGQSRPLRGDAELANGLPNLVAPGDPVPAEASAVPERDAA